MLNWLLDNIYWILPGIILLWLYSKLKAKDPIILKSGKKIDLKDIAVILEVGLIMLGIYLLQRWYFSDHNFLLISLFLFIPIMAGVFWWIFSKDNMYILETAIQGQKLIDLREGRVLYVPVTRNQLMRMDKANYHELEHIGEVKTPWWNFQDLIFCDYFDKEKGILYHSEYAILKNITFYQAKIIWIKLLDEVPDLIKTNLKLTIMGEYRIAQALKQMIKQFPYWLGEIDKQHPEPFALMDLEDILDRVKKEKYHDIEEQVKSMVEKYGSDLDPKDPGDPGDRMSNQTERAKVFIYGQIGEVLNDLDDDRILSIIQGNPNKHLFRISFNEIMEIMDKIDRIKEILKAQDPEDHRPGKDIKSLLDLIEDHNIKANIFRELAEFMKDDIDELSRGSLLLGELEETGLMEIGDYDE